MDIEYPVNIKICLRPVGCPWVKVQVDSQIYTQQIKDNVELVFDFVATGQSCLTIEHFNKPADDPTTAVEITEISFFGISDPRFVWAGTYRPDYPEPWYSQQEPRPNDVLYFQNCLGWNGVYRLDFGVPVFTWMHQVLDLGWVYT